MTINRPGVRNALDPSTVEDIRLSRDEWAQRRDVGVRIGTGHGGKSFAAGADIRKLRDRTAPEALEPGMQRCASGWFEKPVIAAVDGNALGRPNGPSVPDWKASSSWIRRSQFHVYGRM